MGIHSFLLIVQEAQQTGTLEVLMTTSTPAPVLIFMSTMSAFAGHMVQLVIYVGVGFCFFRHHSGIQTCRVVLWSFCSRQRLQLHLASSQRLCNWLFKKALPCSGYSDRGRGS